MGKTYMKALEAIMSQYEKAWAKAKDEWESFGEVSRNTDITLEKLEEKLALLEMTY